MLHWRIQCPACGALLQMTADKPHRLVRCGGCHARFVLPTDLGVGDDTIASWLKIDRDADDNDVGIIDDQAIDEADMIPPSGRTGVLPAIDSSHTRLLRLDGKAALFEFPAERLTDTQFRLAMPRRCLQCGTTSHLQAHVILYVSHSSLPISLETAQSPGPLAIREADVADLEGEKLLASLPPAPNAPHPADMPMPYWLCDMCSAAPAIAGQIRVNSETGYGTCRLLIRNLRAAEEFLVATGGGGSLDHIKLTSQIEEAAEHPWDSLALTVQERLKQWYHPGKDEHFMAYIPDRDRTRTEDGVSGAVISDKRLIYHDNLRHRELNAGEGVEMTLAESKGHGRLKMTTMSWQITSFHVDRAGLRLLRRALVRAKVKATWR